MDKLPSLLMTLLKDKSLKMTLSWWMSHSLHLLQLSRSHHISRWCIPSVYIEKISSHNLR